MPSLKKVPSAISVRDAIGELGEVVYPVRAHPYETDTEAGVVQRNDEAVNSRAETEQARIERLGRQRPDKFPTVWREIGFCFSVVMSQVLTEYFTSGFFVLVPTVAQDLNIPYDASTWPASVYSLILSCFLLPFGRVADMYGGFPVYVAGTAWLGIWSAIAGASQSSTMLNICRALQGLGPAAVLPSSLMLLGSIYRPGPRKNLVFCTYGAMVVLGFYLGILIAGLAGSFISWRWFFFFGAILSIPTAFIAYLTIPSDVEERRSMGVIMDWWGSVTTVAGLILFVFGFTYASHAPNGWATPYIIVSLVLGILILIAAVYVEGWVAQMPLLPLDIFKVKCMKPLLLGQLIILGSGAVYLLYACYYMEQIMGATPIQVVAWCTPLAVGGITIATVGGFILHLIPNTILIIIGSTCFIISPLLFALAPDGASYWAWIFPAMICTTLGLDITFNVTNVFISTTLPARRQGLAGALINVVTQLGVAVCLGWADVVAGATADQGPRKSYKNAFWFEVGCAMFAGIVLTLFVQIDRAKSDLTADEKEEAERARANSEKEGAKTACNSRSTSI